MDSGYRKTKGDQTLSPLCRRVRSRSHICCRSEGGAGRSRRALFGGRHTSCLKQERRPFRIKNSCTCLYFYAVILTLFACTNKEIKICGFRKNKPFNLVKCDGYTLLKSSLRLFTLRPWKGNRLTAFNLNFSMSTPWVKVSSRAQPNTRTRRVWNMTWRPPTCAGTLSTRGYALHVFTLFFFYWAERKAFRW